MSFVARYSAVPRIALASAKESTGFGGLGLATSDVEIGEADATSGKVAFVVDEGDLGVLVLVRRGAAGRGGVSEDISMLG